MEFIEKYLQSERKTWILKDLIETYKSEFPELNIFNNISDNILSKISFTKEAVCDVILIHKLDIISFIKELLNMYDSDQ